MPKLTKFIYATIGLWSASTLLIYTTGYSEATQVLRGDWPLLSLLFAAVLALLSIVAFFIDRPRLWATSAILLAALTKFISYEDVVSLSFNYSIGFLSWTQIIYDPIGVPRPPKAGDFHPNPPYQTYLVKVEPLSKNWYFCYIIDYSVFHADV